IWGISWILRLLVRLETADELYDVADLIVRKSRADSRHPARHCAPDPIEYEFVTSLRVHELRALGGLATVVLMTKPANVAKRALHIERLGGRLLVVGNRAS